MNMDAFWCITLSTILLRRWYKRNFKKEEIAIPPETIGSFSPKYGDAEAEKARKEIAKQRKREEAYLRKQGFDDTLIAAILPTINNDK